jgi:hypothetical protein
MDELQRKHREWIGMAQPDGLVVTASALAAAEANPTWPATELQAALLDLAGGQDVELSDAVVRDLRPLLVDLLEWPPDLLVEGASAPSLHVTLDEGQVLAPTFALRSADDESFVLLVSHRDRGPALDVATDDRRWTATAHQRFERLLRDTGVATGLCSNGRELRLVHAPRGESAGWITFRLHELLEVDGRLLLGVFHMLLNGRRLLTLPADRRLSGLLQASREYQNTVSNRLQEQVLMGLRELLAGFESADHVTGNQLLQSYRGEHLREVYTGLVTVLMRMVFTLYAEERALLPMESSLYAGAYSLTHLHAQLQEDHARFGDALDGRYGAWARLVTLFRILHDGVQAASTGEGDPGLTIPARSGDFFDPDAFPFLEGRPRGSVRQRHTTLDALPRVSDGVVHRVLDRLLVLVGERLQYRGLDVEQIGSVYEGLMGYDLEVAEGDSLCLSPDHVVVSLVELLALDPADRIKRLEAEAGLDAKDKLAAAVKAARTVTNLRDALAKRISPRDRRLIPTGSLYLQPGQERRRTGSHYTPRALTQPIVETTLRPLLARLGPTPRPEELLSLRICDPAMGSGAFLVEACRQLADHLVAAFRRTGTMPDLPRDEDPVLHARRRVAQECLYGVDKNPLAVDLARLSLWLVTFAKDHPFTFVEHALRCGDSLVGLTRDQISSFALDVAKQSQLATIRQHVEPAVARAESLRAEIHAEPDPPDNARLELLWRDADDALTTVRLLGDLVVASYFLEKTDKARARRLDSLRDQVARWLATGDGDPDLRGLVADLRESAHPVLPFHWEIEFPEVFRRDNPGFDAFVGNPPFAGKNTILASHREGYLPYLQDLHEGAHGNSDLIAHFFRRTFTLLRQGGALGLIATNTIAQGDTRATGLRWICMSGGTIYEARRRLKWPGLAAVVVSVLHIQRGEASPPFLLDGREVPRITAFLFHAGGHEDPAPLPENANKSFIGSYVLGMGFTFDDTNPDANPIAEMDRLIAKDPRNAERIFPYLGGEEVNTSPTHSHHRYVINFADMSEDEARQWPDLMAIVEEKVRPERMKLADNADGRRRKQHWWQWGRYTPAMFAAVAALPRVLVVARTSKHLAFAWVLARSVFSENLVAFSVEPSVFPFLQSRLHEGWVRFTSSTLEDRQGYRPTDSFDTFPLASHESNPALAFVGSDYYDHRAALMVKNDEGLTKTYNRFHDPDDRTPDIQKLRALHAALDRAVLDAYGWTDLQPTYDFRPQLDESIRYTWPEETRDEVLARLLELNRQRATEAGR